MVAVDVDDQDVVEATLDRLLAGVGEEPAGVELFERHPPTAIGKKVHGVLLRLQYRTLQGATTMAAPPDRRLRSPAPTESQYSKNVQ